MKSVIKKTVKAVGMIIGVFLMLIVFATLVINSPFVQGKLVGQAVEMLSQKLNTHVEVDKVRVSLLRQRVKITGLLLEDQQQRKMLEVDRLTAGVKILPLIRKEVDIDEVRVSGMRVSIYKEKGTPANYQFVVDAFSSGHQRKQTKDEHPKPPSTDMSLHLKEVVLEQVEVSYNNQKMDFGQLTYGLDRPNEAAVKNLHFTTDSPKPRRNTGKPHRGAFDERHLDVTASFKVEVTTVGSDSICGRITDMEAIDKGSNLKIKRMDTSICYIKGNLRLDSVELLLPHSDLHIDRIDFTLPDTVKGRALNYSSSPVHGTVVLTDIAEPFAPALKGFTLPLLLSTRVNGNKESMTYSDISVSTADKRLYISGSGGINELNGRCKLRVYFDIDMMKLKKGMAKEVVNLFQVKKYMMRQLDQLGDISYSGPFEVLWRHETFSGILGTVAGPLDFHFELDQNTKMLTGKAHTDSLAIGKVLEMPDIGDVSFALNFSFDISKERTARMKQEKNGNLPIGHIDGIVEKASYKSMKVSNLKAVIDSDGAEARGELVEQANYLDVTCSFSFTDTDKLNKMKIHPGIKFRLFSDETKKVRQECKKLGKEIKEMIQKNRQAIKSFEL